MHLTILIAPHHYHPLKHTPTERHTVSSPRREVADTDELEQCLQSFLDLWRELNRLGVVNLFVFVGRVE